MWRLSESEEIKLFSCLPYTFFVLFIIFHYIQYFDFTWQELFNDLELLQSFCFLLVVIIVVWSLTILIVIAACLIQYLLCSPCAKIFGVCWMDGGWSNRPTPSWIALCISLREIAPSDRVNLQKLKTKPCRQKKKKLSKKNDGGLRVICTIPSVKLFRVMIPSGAGNVERLDGEKLKALKGIADIWHSPKIADFSLCSTCDLQSWKIRLWSKVWINSWLIKVTLIKLLQSSGLGIYPNRWRSMSSESYRKLSTTHCGTPRPVGYFSIRRLMSLKSRYLIMASVLIRWLRDELSYAWKYGRPCTGYGGYL